MDLKLQLSNVSPSSFPMVDFDPDFDDARSVISSICEEIEELRIANFLVSGFGDASWPVDVSTDLAAVIEQLPEALAVLERREGEFRLDFYEQGLQRLIFGRCRKDETDLRCQSLTNWQPSPEQETMRTSDFATMLTSIQCQFFNVALATPMSDAARKALATWATPRGASR